MSDGLHYAQATAPETATGRAGRDTAGAEPAHSGAGARDSTAHAGADTVDAPLPEVAAGILGGVPPGQFQDSIDAAGRLLGNRAFLHWVGVLREGEQGAGSRAFAAPGPLQMMPKKKKKKVGAAEAQQEAQAQAGATGQVEVETGPEPPGLPAPTTIPEQGISGEAGAAAGKKKKKSRVQVALNTLRSEGVEAFGAYFEAEIGETELLHNLRGRLLRAEDLGGSKDPALRVVEERMQGLAITAAPQAAAPMPGYALEPPVRAPVKSELTGKERNLFEYCFANDVRKFRRLLRFGKVDINMGSEAGTLLSLAAYRGQTDIIRELLSIRGIDVNLADRLGITPLYYAVQERYPDVVELLLAAPGINPSLVSKSGDTPLYIAAQYGFEEIVQLLLGAPGINVNRTMLQGGTTPLGIAAAMGRAGIVKLLLAAPDIDVDARKHDGATALFLGAQCGCPEVVRLLVKRGADVNLSKFDGTSPLCISIKYRKDEAARILIEASNIHVNQTLNGQATALFLAAAQGNRDLVRLLLRKGADPNIFFDDRIGALHAVCFRGDTAIVRMLLHAGADCETAVMELELESGLKHYTPPMIAEFMEYPELLSILAAHTYTQEEDRPHPASRSGLLPDPQAQQTGLIPAGLPGERLPEQAVPPQQATAGPALEVATGASAPATDISPLAQGRRALIREVLGKLDEDTLEPLEGIRMMIDVRGADSLDALCGIYNRLAGIERQRRRARRQGAWRSAYAVEPAAPPLQADIRYTLGAARDLDAERVEDEIRSHLGQTYHRFVKQAVNNMEFGRGKHTTGYPGLWHVSAGVPGVGSCSVFYHAGEGQARIRIMGIGHHVGRATYELDYAVGELAGAGRTLHIGTMQ